jgi:proteasome lid subunit RPN8/RPN11
MENTDESTSEFAVDPEHQYQVLEAATRDRLEQVGIFHSHPAPPYPSTRDLQFMEHNPCVWIIDGIQNQRHAMKAYQLLGGRLHDVPIRMLS